MKRTTRLKPRRSPSALAAILLALALPSWAGAANAQAPDGPGPDQPLQTRPSKVDDSWVHQGWIANILGISGNGRTLLVVSGEAGYVSTVELEGKTTEKTHPPLDGGEGKEAASEVVFELEDKDHRVALKVRDPRGAEWSESVDVPRGMKVTVDIRARYLHRGYEGTIKNDTLGCKNRTFRRTLRFEIWQGEVMVGNPITLDPGKSAPGVRLKTGVYELRVLEKRGRDFTIFRSVPLEPKEHQWRHDEGCP